MVSAVPAGIERLKNPDAEVAVSAPDNEDRTSTPSTGSPVNTSETVPDTEYCANAFCDVQNAAIDMIKAMVSFIIQI